MPPSGIKKIKLWVDKATGEVVKAKHDNGTVGTQIPYSDVANLHQSTGFKYVGSVLYYEKNPSCIVIVSGGYAWEICW